MLDNTVALRRAAIAGAALLACLAAAAPAARADAPPYDAGPGAARIVDTCVGSDVSRLLDTAAGPENTAERRVARSRLFREVVPFVRRNGRLVGEADGAALMYAAGGYPCATAPLRLVEARTCGRLAVVSIGGGQGGCRLLLGRFDDRWQMVMPLSWTLQG